MAKFHISSAKAETYAGTPNSTADPFGIRGVLDAANPAGVAAGDEIIIWPDGTYSPTALLREPLVGSYDNPIWIRSGVAGTGAETLTKATIDGGSLGAGDLTNINNRGYIIFGLVFQNSPGRGLELNNASACAIRHCEFNNNALDGLYAFGSSQGLRVEYCKASGNGARGIDLQGSFGSGAKIAINCYCKDNMTGNFAFSNQSASRGPNAIYNSVSIYDSVTPAGSWHHFAVLASQATISHCLALQVAAENSANDLYGVQVATQGRAIIDSCIFSGIKNSGAGSGYGAYTGAAVDLLILGGNIWYDLDNTTGGSGSVLQDYEASRDTTNPAFTSSTDYTPTADLSGKSFPTEALGTETDWLVPGPVQPGGGSSILLSRGIFTGGRM